MTDEQHEDWAAEPAVGEAEPQSTHEVVEHGDTVHDFAERHGVPVEDLVRFNEPELRREAQARGFDPMFYREGEPEWRVFPGVPLRVREDPQSE